MAQQLKTNHEIVSDKAKNPVTTSEYIKHGNKWLNDAVNEATVEVTKKANKDYVDAELAKKANAADLTALETTVSGKADSSTVAGISERVTQNTTKTADLQSQIDNLVIEAGGDSNPEVIQARTDAAGVTHTTLKDRIDSEVTDLKGDLSHEIADISIGKNLYDYSRSHAGYIDLQNGSIHDATGSWHYSDRYIPVSVGDVLYANERHFVAYYDTNLNFISGLQIPASLNTTVPASAVFARFSSPSGSKTSVVCKNVYDGAAGSFNYKLNGLNVMYLYPYLVESVSAMPVIDTLADDITIKMNFGKGATAPTNFPFEKFPNYGLYTFTNITNKNNVNNIGGVQTIEFANGRWRRVKSTSWGAWEFSGNNFVYVRHGANPATEPTIYTSFSQAVILNRDIPNTTIYLNSDTYDIYQELVALYGQDFFDNHTVSGRDGHGLELGSGMTIIGTAKSVIAFNYTGTNNSVMTNYSPIMMPAADCTLKNIKITANNCKYVVHDDPINKGARWEHIYDNVQMVMDNSNNPHGNNYRCIGGGLGNQSTIIIRSCYFEAVGTADTKYLISWHNCVNAAALGSIDIDGCYFSDTGAIRIANYGESTLKTMVLIHNNRLGANTFLTYESSYTIENFAVREYCNSNQ